MGRAMKAEALLIARRVRRVVRRWGADDFPSNMNGACAVASYVLFRAFRAVGFPASFVCGQMDDGGGHCWVECWGRIFDITASQFGGKAVVVLPVKTKRTDANYQGRITRNAQALKETSKWDWHQSPLLYEDKVERYVRRLEAR